LDSFTPFKSTSVCLSEEPSQFPTDKIHPLLHIANLIAGFITSSSCQDGVQATLCHSLEFLTSLTQLDPFLLLLLAILRNTRKDIYFIKKNPSFWCFSLCMVVAE